jgi:hypothetical protein
LNADVVILPDNHYANDFGIKVETSPFREYASLIINISIWTLVFRVSKRNASPSFTKKNQTVGRYFSKTFYL